MHELAIQGLAQWDEGDILSHIRQALSLNLPELQIPPCTHDGTFVIVGSSPTVVDQVEKIKAEREQGRPICAINGAHDFLIERGITPDLFLTVDPRPMPQNFKHVNDETVYIVASRCHPETFKTLEGRRVLLWHAWSDNTEGDFLASLKGKIAIGGGSTSGLRAINVAYLLGFKRVHLYGMDSCLKNNFKRWNDTKPLNGEEVSTTDVIVGNKQFFCNMAMAQQANEFQSIYEVMPDITIESFGDGLLSAILEERRKQGLHA